MTDKWMTIEEVAREARVVRRTVYYWMQNGKLEYVKLPSGRIRINRETVFRNETKNHGNS